MKVVRAVLLSFLLTSALTGQSVALAGAWTSGGGELIKDGQNPWFVKSTSRVSYCIEVGRDFSEQSPTALRQDIDDAIAYWKHHFELMRPFKKARLPDGSTVDVGTQVFDFESCRRETDIVFQFGVLADVQRKFIGDPTRFVALSIRTDYDPVTLRGKGFVYVSPDTGPDRYAGDELVDRAWTRGDGGLLLATLIHEFGHIFGFPHVPRYAPGEGPFVGVMSERFAEEILDKSISTIFQSRRSTLITLRFLVFDYVRPAPIEQCAPNRSSVFGFFGADEQRGHCFQFVLTQNGMRVYQSRFGGEPLSDSIFLGTIDVEGGLDFAAGRIQHSNYLPANLYLTKDQRVFDLDPAGSTPFYPRSVAVHELVVFKLNGTFVSQDSMLRRVVRCEIGAADFTIAAEFGGKIFENIIAGY